jgi:hypothetical protein
MFLNFIFLFHNAEFMGLIYSILLIEFIGLSSDAKPLITIHSLSAAERSLLLENCVHSVCAMCDQLPWNRDSQIGKGREHFVCYPHNLHCRPVEDNAPVRAHPKRLVITHVFGLLPKQYYLSLNTV